MEKVVVAIRVRPLNARELSLNEKCIWSVDPFRGTITLSASSLCDMIESKTQTMIPNTIYNFGTLDITM